MKFAIHPFLIESNWLISPTWPHSMGAREDMKKILKILCLLWNYNCINGLRECAWLIHIVCHCSKNTMPTIHRDNSIQIDFSRFYLFTRFCRSCLTRIDFILVCLYCPVCMCHFCASILWACWRWWMDNKVKAGKFKFMS